jgi:hypothetical protein
VNQFFSKEQMVEYIACKASLNCWTVAALVWSAEFQAFMYSMVASTASSLLDLFSILSASPFLLFQHGSADKGIIA